MDFRWNAVNVEHIAEHGVSPDEAEYVVVQSRSTFPRKQGDGKYLVWGQGPGGDYLQVVFIYSPPGVIYVIHARPLGANEKRLYRRMKK